MPPATVERARQDFQKMKDHILATYSNVEVAQSFVDADGQHVDCIKLEDQPGLRAGEGRPAAPPAFEGGPAPPGPRPAAPMLAEGKKDAFGNPMQCPAGFVPVLRL